MYYVDEYKADRKRYETMQYNRCGKSGLKLPAVSLGLWHNFGSKDNYDMMKNLCFTAFELWPNLRICRGKLWTDHA